MLAMAIWAHPANAKVQPGNAYNAAREKTAGFAFPVLGALGQHGHPRFTPASGMWEGWRFALATATLLVAGVRLTLTVRGRRR